MGGRVAGASTALLLARAGLSVALVDRGRRGSDTLSTHAPDARRGPPAVPLGRAGRRRGRRHPGRPAHRLPPRGRRGRRRHHPAPVRRGRPLRTSPPPARPPPRRGRRAGRRTRAARDNGDVAAPRRLGPRGRRRRPRPAAERRVDLAAGLTVGADGIRSRVAEQVGATTTWRGRTSSAVLYRYVEDPQADGYEWTYGAGAAAGIIPTNDGASCLFVSTTPARMRSLRRLGVGAGRSPGCWPPRVPPPWIGRAGSGRSRRCAGGPACPASPASQRGRVGAGGGRGLLQGPDHVARHHRRAARRRAARRAGARRPTPARSRSTSRWRATRQTRDRLSRELFESPSSVAAYDWDAPGHPLAAPPAQRGDGRRGRAPRAARPGRRRVG